MRNLVGRFRTHMQRLQSYHADGAHEIALSNIQFLKLASTASIVLLAALMIVARVLIRDWMPSPIHLAFVPLLGAFFLFSWFRLDHIPLEQVPAVCIAFEILLYTMGVSLDTLGDPGAPSSFTQLICVALPALFILPGLISYGLLLITETAYVVLILMTKGPFIAQYDIFEMVTGLCFSICVSQLISRSRLATHDLKTKFELLSMRDTLSNLYNKRGFLELANRYFADANPKVTCSLAFIDIDDFKTLNDTRGHAAGDEALAAMGSILSVFFRSNDIVCRFGGDEFLIVIDKLADTAILEDRFASIRSRFTKQTYSLTGIALTVSCGIVYAQRERVDFNEMTRQADEALYRAKRSGKARCVIHRYDQRAAQLAQGTPFNPRLTPNDAELASASKEDRRG